MENEKIINKVKNKIAISNFELEERIVMNKRKKILSITSVIAICLICSFVTVNATTGNAVVDTIERTINKLFNKDNITMDYVKSHNIVVDKDKENSEIDQKEVREIKHNGVDLKAEYGEDVVVIADGEVVEAGYNIMGNYILIKHNNSDFTYTKYAHLSKINVKVGDIVEKDTKIGEAGKTGNATGVCLHFEVLDKDMNSINPNDFLN